MAGEAQTDAAQGPGQEARQQVRHKREQVERAKLLGDLFPRWDLDHNGFIDYDEMYQVVSLLQKGSSKHARRTWAKWLQTARALHRDEGFGIAEFTGLLEELTASMDMADFVGFLANVNHAVEELHSTPHGKRAMKIRELFLKWDFDHNGFVSFEELDVVFEAADAFREHKALRKAIRKLKVERLQEYGQFAFQLTQQEFSEFLHTILGPMDDDTFFAALEQFSRRLDIVFLARERLRRRTAGRRASLTATPAPELPEDDDDDARADPHAASVPVGTPLPVVREVLPPLPASGAVTVGFAADNSRQSSGVSEDHDEHSAPKSPNSSSLRRIDSVWKGDTPMSPRYVAPGEEGAGPAEDDEEAELARRETVVADLFYSWDLNHDYLVDADEMALVLRHVEEALDEPLTYAATLAALRAGQPATLDQGAFIDALLQATADLPKGDFSALVAIVEEVLGELEEGEDEAVVDPTPPALAPPSKAADSTPSSPALREGLPMLPISGGGRVGFVADAADPGLDDAEDAGDDTLPRVKSVWDGGSAMSPRWRVAGEGLTVDGDAEAEGDEIDLAHRESVVADLFYSWDLNHDYLVDAEEMATVLRRVGFQRKFRETFGEVLVKLWETQPTTMEQGAFIEAFLEATATVKEGEFAALIATLEETLAELAAEAELASPRSPDPPQSVKAGSPTTATTAPSLPPLPAGPKVAFADGGSGHSSGGGKGEADKTEEARARTQSVWDGGSAMSPRYRMVGDGLTVTVGPTLESAATMAAEDFEKRENMAADVFYFFDLNNDYDVDQDEMALVLRRMENDRKKLKDSVRLACEVVLTKLWETQPTRMDQTDFVDAFLEATSTVKEADFALLATFIEEAATALAAEAEGGQEGIVGATTAGREDTPPPLLPLSNPKVGFAEGIDFESSVGGGRGGGDEDELKKHLSQSQIRARSNSVWANDSAMSPRWKLVGEGLMVDDAPMESAPTMFAEDFMKRESVAADLFYSWDLNHDYQVDDEEMALVLRRLESKRKALKRSVREACGKMMTELWATQPITMDQTDFIDAFLDATAKVKEAEFTPLIAFVEGVIAELAAEVEASGGQLPAAPPGDDIEVQSMSPTSPLPHLPLTKATTADDGAAEMVDQDPGARVRANSVWDGGCAMSPRWRLVGEGLKVEEAPEPSGDGSLEEFAHREKAVADLFYLWDLDHDYVVDPKEMAMVLRRFGDTRKLREGFGAVLVRLWDVQRATLDQGEFIDAFLRATERVKEAEFPALIAGLEELLGELAKEVETSEKEKPPSETSAAEPSASPKRRAMVAELSVSHEPEDDAEGAAEVNGPRRVALSALFPRWDFNKDAFLQPAEMHEVLYRLEEQRAFREVFSDFLVGLWNISHLTLDREEFLIKMTPLTNPLSEEEFSVLAAAMEQVVTDAFTNQKARPISAVEDYAGERRLRLAQKALPVLTLTSAKTEDFLDIISQAEREPALQRLFPKWDMDHDNKLNLLEFQQVLYRLQRQRAFRETFGHVLVDLWAVNHTVTLDTFVPMMLRLTAKLDEDAFRALVFSVEQLLDELAGRKPAGPAPDAPALLPALVPPATDPPGGKRRSRPSLSVSDGAEAAPEARLSAAEQQARRQVAEELFPMWDFNGNGKVDPSEHAAALGYLQAQHSFRESFGRFLVLMWATADCALPRDEFVRLFLQRTEYLTEEEEFLALVVGVEQALVHLAETLSPTSRPRPEAKLAKLSSAVRVKAEPVPHNVEERRYVLSGLFPRWDINANGILDPPEVVQVLRQLQQQRPFRESFGELLLAMWPMEQQGLDREGFVSALLQLTGGVPPTAFPALVLGLEEALNEVAKLTGEPLRRAMWNLFVACDPLNQGLVDWPTLLPVFREVPALKSRMALSSPSRGQKLDQVTLSQFQQVLLDALSRFGEEEAIALLAQVEAAARATPLAPAAGKDPPDRPGSGRAATPPMSRHEAEVRRYVVSGMFKEWDLNGSGLVEADELRHVVHTVCEMRLSFPKNVLLHLIVAPDGKPLQAALEEKPFANLLLDATRRLDHDAFREFMDVARTAVDHCRAMRHGPRNTAIWQLFDLWDENKDGLIYFTELVTAVGNLEHSGIASQSIQAFSLSWRKHFDEFQRQREHTLSLNQFHRFLDAVYKDLPDEQFISVIRELRRVTRAALEVENSLPQEEPPEVTAAVEAPSPPKPRSLAPLLSPRTTDTIHELLACRGARTFKRSVADAVQAALLFNVRHALDGVSEGDVPEVLVVAAEDKPALFTVCAVLCLLLRYYKVDAHLEVEECVGLVQQQMRTQGQLLNDILYFDVQKSARPVVEKVLELCEADPAGLVPCRLLIFGKLWAALCTWVRCILAYIIHLHPKWKLEEPKWDVLPEPKTPRLVCDPPLLLDVLPPHGAAAIALLNPGMAPQYTSARGSPNSPLLPPVEVRSSKPGLKGRTVTGKGDYALPTISALSTGLRSIAASDCFEDAEKEFMFTEAEIQSTFETYDKDGKGWIWKQEFKELYAKLDFLGHNEPAQLDTMLRRFGTVDGKLTFTEFAILMLKIAQR